MNDVGKAIEFIKHYLEPTRVVVECPKHILNERTIKKIGKYSIRKDPPHTGGDEYHAHSKLGGYEVCWTASGKRRHQNRFPADNKIPWCPFNLEYFYAVLPMSGMRDKWCPINS